MKRYRVFKVFSTPPSWHVCVDQGRFAKRKGFIIARSLEGALRLLNKRLRKEPTSYTRAPIPEDY